MRGRRSDVVTLAIWVRFGGLSMRAAADRSPRRRRPAAKDVHVLAFGDSLTAGYGLPPGQGFAPQLEAALRRNGVAAPSSPMAASRATPPRRAGRGSPGRWTACGAKPDLAIVALGANDMLRGLPPARRPAPTSTHPRRAEAARYSGAGRGHARRAQSRRRYGADFNRIFPDLARKHGAALYPFFLAGVAGNRAGPARPDPSQFPGDQEDGERDHADGAEGFGEVASGPTLFPGEGRGRAAKVNDWTPAFAGNEDRMRRPVSSVPILNFAASSSTQF